MTTETAYLSTRELLDRIREVFRVTLDPRTITAWVARDRDPLPVTLRARRGQGHKYDWATVHPWLERELTRTINSDDIDTMDMYGAKTVSARARAKMDTIELAVIEQRYGEITAMEQAAEDCARQAVNRLMALPSRLAPRLALMTDELQIDRLLDDEIRQICNEIDQAARAGLTDQDPTAATADAV